MSSNSFKLVFLTLWCSFLITAFQAHAEGADIQTPPPPAVEASGFILQDFHTGKVLAENNSDVRLAPASLTKIMTVYVVFREIANGHLHLDDLATISKKAWGTSGSRMFIEVNDRVKIEDLLKGVIIQSGNDASVALAEHVAGSEDVFAAMMNQHAERLGMKNTRFKNSDGLPMEGHYTTPRDLAILTTALIKEFPDFYRWFSEKEFTYNKIVQHNRNQLLGRDPSVDGVKTGHTEEAGYCLVASALRDDMRLISVVMGAKSINARAVQNQNLLNYGFRFYESHKLYDGKKSLSDARVWKGDVKELPLGLAEDLYATIPRGHYKELNAVINVNKHIIAPVSEGAELGSVDVSFKGEPVIKKDLIALKTINKGNIFRQLVDSAILLVVNRNGQ
ncbi:MAG: D-alanyl-D-alanine carboxypeptidase family protein [Gammaproteobacteria bacterium]